MRAAAVIFLFLSVAFCQTDAPKEDNPPLPFGNNEIQPNDQNPRPRVFVQAQRSQNLQRPQVNDVKIGKSQYDGNIVQLLQPVELESVKPEFFVGPLERKREFARAALRSSPRRAGELGLNGIIDMISAVLDLKKVSGSIQKELGIVNNAIPFAELFKEINNLHPIAQWVMRKFQDPSARGGRTILEEAKEFEQRVGHNKVVLRSNGEELRKIDKKGIEWYANNEVIFRFGAKGNADPRTLSMLLAPFARILLFDARDPRFKGTAFALVQPYGNDPRFSDILRGVSERLFGIASRLPPVLKNRMNSYVAAGLLDLTEESRKAVNPIPHVN